jgi:hypothetical protein
VSEPFEWLHIVLLAAIVKRNGRGAVSLFWVIAGGAAATRHI